MPEPRRSSGPMLPYLSRRLGPDDRHTRAAAEQAGRTR